MMGSEELMKAWEAAEGLVLHILKEDYRDMGTDEKEEALADCRVAFFEYAHRGGNLEKKSVGAVMRSRLYARRVRCSVRLTEGDERVLRQALFLIHQAEQNGERPPTMDELRENVYLYCFNEVKERVGGSDSEIDKKLSRRGILAALRWLPELLGLRTETRLDAETGNGGKVGDFVGTSSLDDGISEQWMSLLGTLSPEEQEALVMVADGEPGKDVEQATGITLRQVKELEGRLRKRAQSPSGAFALFAPGIEDLVVFVDSDESWIEMLLKSDIGQKDSRPVVSQPDQSRVKEKHHD